jgi:hypothetical protein
MVELLNVQFGYKRITYGKPRTAVTKLTSLLCKVLEHPGQSRNSRLHSQAPNAPLRLTIQVECFRRSS